MTSTTIFEFGDVVLVPFPFTSQTISKKRPALIVSSHTYNVSRPDVVLMAVTSQLRETAAIGEVWLQDWKGAGLLKASSAKPVFATFEQSLVIRKLGVLSSTDREAVHRAILQVLGQA
ncbi:MAG: type II toxin-antitoxin system PemK/MazF family toxin [Alphaproteobacteria bacterium]|nr:type II toxin-antitoxin system PemK/MazF family toxin [Alphaproteobacteria bacterium]